jgi:hypothetical protein
MDSCDAGTLFCFSGGFDYPLIIWVSGQLYDVREHVTKHSSQVAQIRGDLKPLVRIDQPKCQKFHLRKAIFYAQVFPKCILVVFRGG